MPASKEWRAETQQFAGEYRCPLKHGGHGRKPAPGSLATLNQLGLRSSIGTLGARKMEGTPFSPFLNVVAQTRVHLRARV
jgi:hypothetical protein